MRALFVLAFVSVSVACGGNVADPSADASPTGSNDPSTDGATESGAKCASRPPQDCRVGAEGDACEETPITRVCTADGWVCPAGTVPVDRCGCSTGGVGGPPLDAGQPCTPPAIDAGPATDAGTTCASGASCGKEGDTCTTTPPCHYPPTITCTCTSGVWSCPPACI